MVTARDVLKKGYGKFIEVISGYSPVLATYILYLQKFHRVLNLKEPRTLNEKIMWLKLNDYNNNSLITMCADKYKVRDYVIEKHHEDLLNNLYDVWDSPSQIDWEKLPNQFVLKCNHGCGYNIICSDKTALNKTAVLNQIKKWYEEDFWKKKAELNYKHIEKKIICEKYLENTDHTLIADYKVYCFHGKALYILVCDNKITDRKFYFFNSNWEFQRINPDSINAVGVPSFGKPDCLQELLRSAEDLSEPFPFVRVDFYIVNNKPIFGELTFTPAAGLDANRLKETDIMFGNLVNLTI